MYVCMSTCIPLYATHENVFRWIDLGCGWYLWYRVQSRLGTGCGLLTLGGSGARLWDDAVGRAIVQDPLFYRLAVWVGIRRMELSRYIGRKVPPGLQPPLLVLGDSFALRSYVLCST